MESIFEPEKAPEGRERAAAPTLRRKRFNRGAEARRLAEAIELIEAIQKLPWPQVREIGSKLRLVIDHAIEALEQPKASGPLSLFEGAVLAALTRAAERAEACPTADDLLEHIGFGAQSTTVAVIRRLEERGYIKVDRYQRSRRVTILATGKSTRRPENTTPHWRSRSR
jgi:DNA-binding MarR family transcriptional regulator